MERPRDLESLIAVVLLVVGTRTVTVRCTATNGRGWTGDQELCIVCSAMTAALACVTLCVGSQQHRSRRWLELLTHGLNTITNTGRSISCVNPEARGVASAGARKLCSFADGRCARRARPDGRLTPSSQRPTPPTHRFFFAFSAPRPFRVPPPPVVAALLLTKAKSSAVFNYS